MIIYLLLGKRLASHITIFIKSRFIYISFLHNGYKILSNYYIMIPEVFRDNTTIVKNHPMRNHLFCVSLRSILGILVISNKINKNILLIISFLVLVMFLAKFFKLPNVWKVYMRTVIVYAIVFILTLKFGDQYNSVSGTLIIVDALMGLQARHIFDRLSLLK